MGYQGAPPGAAKSAREQSLEAQRNFWCLIAMLFGLVLVATVVIPRWRGTDSKPAAETPTAGGPSRTAPEPERDDRPIEPSRPSPAESRASLSAPPSSPGVVLRFDDIQAACGDLSYPNFLCLVNRGSEPAAGGARLVLTESEASFQGRGTYNNGLTINVEGKERYSLDFGPAKGRPLLPGLYTGAVRWPFNNGPYPGIDVSVGSSGCNEEDGQFRILKISVDEGHVRQFMADFETTCNGAIGRVSMTGPAPPSSPGDPRNPIDLRRHTPSPG